MATHRRISLHFSMSFSVALAVVLLGCNHASNDTMQTSFISGQDSTINSSTTTTESTSTGHSDSTSSTSDTTSSESSETTGETVQYVAFRWNSIQFEDPHFYKEHPDFGWPCADDTTESFNIFLNLITIADVDQDKNLDFNIGLLFDDSFTASSSGGGELEFTFGICTAPIESTVCTKSDAPSASIAYTNADSCLAPDAAVLSYDLSLEPVPGPCFTTDKIANFNLEIFGVSIPLVDVEISAQYQGDPATSLTSGIMRGFIRKADTDNILIPEDFDIGSDMPVSSLFCKPEDLDHYNGEPGWWGYLTFTAEVVPWTN